MGEFTIRIQGGDTAFEVKDGETMLDAALRAGVGVRYGCRRGKCATCKHLVVSGDYDNSGASAYALLEEEREEGLTLLCQTYPLSDCTVDLALGQDREFVRLPRPITTTALVDEVSVLSGQVVTLKLALDAPFRFLPGQYVEIEVPGRSEESRSYSIASAVFEPRHLELLIERRPSGTLSGQVEALAGTPLRVSGPYGRLFYRPASRPVVLVAEGVGVAPFLSILAYVRSQDWPVSIRLLHAGDDPSLLPYHQRLVQWSERARAFSYHPLVGTGGEEYGWANGDIGAGLIAHVESGEPADVYISGSERFCDRVEITMEARGIDSERIFVERFYPA